MTELKCGAIPTQEEMVKVLEDGEVFFEKVCLNSRKWVEEEGLLKLLKGKI